MFNVTVWDSIVMGPVIERHEQIATLAEAEAIAKQAMKGWSNGEATIKKTLSAGSILGAGAAGLTSFVNASDYMAVVAEVDANGRLVRKNAAE